MIADSSSGHNLLWGRAVFVCLSCWISGSSLSALLESNLAVKKNCLYVSYGDLDL